MTGLVCSRRPLLRAIPLMVMFAGASSCSHEIPPPIQVRETDILVQNQTKAAWSGIEIWVNDHFRGLFPALAPGQQLVVPLDNLVAAFGQRFDRHRQPVFGVLVTARSSDGHDVRLTWGKVRRL
jgi:hypothetical protein